MSGAAAGGPGSTLVLGIGNLLLRDDGVGPHAVRALRARPLPANVEALDVGTAFLDAIPALEGAVRLVVVDAMRAGGAPGTVYRIALGECAVAPRLASLHGLDLARVLFLAGRTDRPEAVVIGVEPSRIEWGVELSPELSRALPAVIAAVRREVGVGPGEGARPASAP